MRKFITESLKPFQFWIGLFILSDIYWAFDMCIRPYLLKIIINTTIDLSPRDSYQSLFFPALYYFLVLCGRIFFSQISLFSWININAPLKRSIGKSLMDKMMHHSLHLHQNSFTGNLNNKIKDVMGGVPEIVKLVTKTMLGPFLLFIGAVIVLASIDKYFVSLLFLWMVMFISGSHGMIRHLHDLSFDSAEKKSKVMGFMVDVLGNITNVRLFAGRQHEKDLLSHSLKTYVKANKARDRKAKNLALFHDLSFLVYQALSLFLLIEGYKRGTITAGDFAFILTLNKSILSALKQFSTGLGKYTELHGNIKQGLKIVLSPLDIQDKPNAKYIKIKKGKIKLEKIHFHHKGASPLFQNLSLTIHPGEKVGLVGYSGSGKTTFINLILRLFDIQSGRILIDNQDITNHSQDSLHKEISMIPQDPTLFHRSIKENIRYGNFEARDKDIIEAAKQAFAHDFISHLSSGYETGVGERGIKLSGGQRQRIAIARAILKNAPILILDEATSQLDSLTESRIQASLDRLMEGKTTLIIAHRLSTLLNMDRILVFSNGKIVEDGPHDELLKKESLYKKMWDAQTGGFLPSIN